MTESETKDFEKWLEKFLKCPILLEQEAKIVCAMIDGTINKEGAKKVFQWVVEQNLKAHNEFVKEHGGNCA